ncbi:helix-turn-helix domain-containing protein [Euzebya tangerina]|uniref:helix-turn-helix domain-containing protein n=1 Tax=Euzebya tangerina TaxID=591198 RepID=UPI001F0C3849|nr:helix-turn-helix domain-containing protein [Euzebya tangerina]
MIGANTRRYRLALGWSQDALATASGLSKGTVVAIEQQRSNPSVATLCALSETLGVGLSTLIEAPAGPLVKQRRVGDAVTLWSTESGSCAKLLIGTDPPAGVELWEWQLRPGDRFDGAAHPRGTTETIRVSAGVLEVTVGPRSTEITADDVLVFQAHDRHTYRCVGDSVVTFSMWIVVGDEGEMPAPHTLRPGAG